MIGRAFLYGLAAFGQKGVEKALQLLANELDVSMAFVVTPILIPLIKVFY